MRNIQLPAVEAEWTEDDVRRVLEDWRHSGQTIAAFARQRGLSAPRLYWWRRRLSKDRPVAPPSMSLVPARVMAKPVSADQSAPVVRGSVERGEGGTRAAASRSCTRSSSADRSRFRRESSRSKAQLVLFIDALSRGEAGDVLAQGDPRQDANAQLRGVSGIADVDDDEPKTKAPRARPPTRQPAPADLPRVPNPISVPGGKFGNALVIDMLVGKYSDGLPLHRQKDRYARLGLDLAVSTL
jgi:hypothetical protein